MGRVQFHLPPKGSISSNGYDDPLRYYYVPIVGNLYVSRINMTLRLLEQQVYSSILEIGYGSGLLMPTLCQLSDRVFGVDIESDPDLTEQELAKLGCSPQLSQGVPNRLLFEDESLELVVAISVLEHIQAIAPFLKEIHRVLKPGGVLLVGMPAVNKTMEYLFQLIGYSGIENHHVTSPEEMYQASQPLFLEPTSAQLPGFFPTNLYLYKSFHFKKPA